jgi:hypothetical protein
MIPSSQRRRRSALAARTRTILPRLALGLGTVFEPLVARAHRLDEYLQATLVDVRQDEVRLKMRLTPGVQASDEVIWTIDLDGDGRMSPKEVKAFGAPQRTSRSRSIIVI